jgi:phosphoesterase RecJ-like protein
VSSKKTESSEKIFGTINTDYLDVNIKPQDDFFQFANGTWVKNTEIPNLLFDNSSFGRLQLLGRALQNMKVYAEHKTAYTYLTQDELDAFDHVKGDTEGIVNYGLSIRGIVFTAIFIENKDEKIIKISFRSQGDFDVNQFARDHFNGGGHINASGGKSENSMEDALRKFEDLVKNLPI